MRHALKTCTADLHDMLESLWTPHGGFASKSAYLDFLKALHRTHSRLGLAAMSRIGTDWDIAEERARIAALDQDLDGMSHAHHQTTEMDEGYAWGVGYVLNGSTLGASVLLKQGHIEKGWPCAYLKTGRTYAATGALKHFFDRLEKTDAPEDRVMTGAKETFQHLAPRTPARLGQVQ